jgi:hypothetical protein
MTTFHEFCSSLKLGTVLHGNHCENDNRITLRAGSLSMIYENGNLRYISDGKKELIRMVYSAVRDREWLTIIPIITAEKIVVNPESFNIEYDCLYCSGKISFSATYKIEGLADNTIIFSLEGEALSTFEKNRIGFCVLHPVEGYSGNECLIVHPDNSTEKCQFPINISPLQPFKDISSMKWIINEINCDLNFYGDIFETEDQRNWTDASYKTYSTPLNLPYPATVKKGDRINQRVEFKAITITKPEKEWNSSVVITIYPEKISPFPKIGIGKSTRREPLSENEIKILRSLPFDHYRVDLYLFLREWKVNANAAVNEALRLEYPVEFALFFDDNATRQADEFTQWLSEKNIEVTIISLFHKSHQVTPDLLTYTISQILKDAFPAIIIAIGTNANFAQLNRIRPGSVNADHICYSIHPQEHAFDNATLTENLQAQQYTVESIRKFSKGMGIWISPVTIQRRFNANVENFESLLRGEIFPAQVDARQMSLFGACWTTGSLKYLMESGIKGVTYFETVGERGIFQGDYPSLWPSDFQSLEGMIFPLFHIFRFVLKYKSYKIIRSMSRHPLNVDLLTLSDGKRYKIILVNFTSELQDLIIPFEGDYTVKQLNNKTFAEAAQDIDWIDNSSGTTFKSEEEIHLAPFSVSFIE